MIMAILPPSYFSNFKFPYIFGLFTNVMRRSDNLSATKSCLDIWNAY